jgi:hypothetical protein
MKPREREALRERMAAAVDKLIAVLDRMDRDADFEPYITDSLTGREDDVGDQGELGADDDLDVEEAA